MEKILRDTATKICANRCHHEDLRAELQSDGFINSISSIAELLMTKMHDLTKILTKKRNVQKFYASFFAKVVLPNQTFAPNMSNNASTLLLSKAADLVIVYFKSQLFWIFENSYNNLGA